MSKTKKSKPFADQWWAFQTAKSIWEDGLEDLLGYDEGFERLGTDYYDQSLEIHGATNDWRLNEAQQRYIAEAGFAKVYVNHEDGWWTHYSFRENGKPKEFPISGWRRRYVKDPNVKTTRVMAGPEDNGYWEISYLPEGWGERGQNGLATGYYRIVPDAHGALDEASDGSTGKPTAP